MNYFTPFVHVFNQQKEVDPASTARQAEGTRSHVSPELSRLLTAAVVNQQFQLLLLTDPETALAAGFNSESFALSAEERDRVLSIRASTLQHFAEQLIDQSSHIEANEQSPSHRTQRHRTELNSHSRGSACSPKHLRLSA